MKLKKDITLHGIQPAMVMGCMVIEDIYKGAGEEFLITSCTEGKHSRQSNHYLGYAIDIRIWNLINHKPEQMVKAMKKGLGEEFIVILEEDHIHVHFKGSIQL